MKAEEVVAYRCGLEEMIRSTYRSRQGATLGNRCSYIDLNAVMLHLLVALCSFEG